MGILPRLLESRKYGPSNDYWYNPVVSPTGSGVLVSEKDAAKYLTVFACTSLISGDVGRLPLNLYRKRKGGGKDAVTDHKMYDVLHNAPNPDMSSFLYRETSQGHLLYWGNHYSSIERDNAGNIIALWPIPDPGAVRVYRRNGALVYEYEVDGKPVTRRRDQIFHIPGFGFNGLVGMSMIGIAREAIGMGLAAETFGSNYFSQGTHPAGILSMDVDLGDSEGEYLKALKTNYEGVGKSHSVMVFQNGETYTPLTVPMDDAQFLETRDHQKIEICGMYHVPPHKIAIHGQNSNYNNLEQENASYVDSCLMHWLVRWESAISLQLLTEKERRSGLFFEFQVQGLLRGDSAARADYYNKLFQVGAMSPNKILNLENMNPVEGGDQHFVMLNMVPLDQAEEMQIQAKEVEPKEEEKDNFREFFKKDSALRSVRMRDRIARRYKPLILDAAEAVVRRETEQIKRRIAGRQARAGAESMGDFLNDFYKKFPEYVSRKMGPVLRSYLLAVIDESEKEIGSDAINLDVEIKQYVWGYADRHASSSHGQMTALLESDDLTALDTRADEWQERRPEKITTDESVRASGAAFSWVVFGAGLSLVWRIRGDKTCPYCKSLNNRKISAGGSFVKAGDELDPKDGTGKMRFYGLKKHPPLHQGCDCYVSAG
ncbi:MAG: phage portal protein [FCB group bacterium]|nr:phage portal protein [FCB group bacterium]